MDIITYFFSSTAVLPARFNLHAVHVSALDDSQGTAFFFWGLFFSPFRLILERGATLRRTPISAESLCTGIQMHHFWHHGVCVSRMCQAVVLSFFFVPNFVPQDYLAVSLSAK